MYSYDRKQLTSYMNRLILLIILFSVAEPLVGQNAGLHSFYWNKQKSAPLDLFERNTTKLLLARQYYTFAPFNHSIDENEQNISKSHRINFSSPQSVNYNSSSTNTNAQTSIWKEMGYVLAMEVTFTGMSYLASRENNWGPAIAGGFDGFMGLAGFGNISHQDTGIKKTGYFLISAGFIAKSLYNFHFGKDHGANTRFLTNFIGFNVLVFSGYFLDTLD